MRSLYFNQENAQRDVLPDPPALIDIRSDAEKADAELDEAYDNFLREQLGDDYNDYIAQFDSIEYLNFLETQDCPEVTR